MKKIQAFFISLLVLLVSITPVTALADSRSTTVQYSVPATVTYKDYDGTSTTQKVEVGTILKAPKEKGKPGCLFEGWKNEATGQLWNFANHVTEHMTLTASYSEFQEDAEGNVPIGKGEFSVSIKVETNTTDVTVETSSKELLNTLLQDGTITSGELKELTDGASMEVVLVVKDGTDTVTDAVKEKMQQAADGYTAGQYLDISLIKYLTVNGKTGEGKVISNTSGLVTVSLKVPDSMINTDKTVERSYVVVRNHEGKIDLLDSKYDADTHRITFQTNLFSDYAIFYKDVKKTNLSANTENRTDTKPTASETSTAVTPSKTGDSTQIFSYVVTLLVSFVVAGVLLYRKRNDT